MLINSPDCYTCLVLIQLVRAASWNNSVTSQTFGFLLNTVIALLWFSFGRDMQVGCLHHNSPHLGRVGRLSWRLGEVTGYPSDCHSFLFFWLRELEGAQTVGRKKFGRIIFRRQMIGRQARTVRRQQIGRLGEMCERGETQN